MTIEQGHEATRHTRARLSQSAQSPVIAEGITAISTPSRSTAGV